MAMKRSLRGVGNLKWPKVWWYPGASFESFSANPLVRCRLSLQTNSRRTERRDTFSLRPLDAVNAQSILNWLHIWSWNSKQTNVKEGIFLRLILKTIRLSNGLPAEFRAVPYKRLPRWRSKFSSWSFVQQLLVKIGNFLSNPTLATLPPFPFFLLTIFLVEIMKGSTFSHSILLSTGYQKLLTAFVRMDTSEF